MKKVFSLACFVLSLASHAGAQEAFVAQVGSMTVSASAPVQVDISVDSIHSTTLGNIPVAVSVNTDFQDNLLPGIPSSGAIAHILQSGNSNSASIAQDDLQSALIAQTGRFSSATIQQGAGALNRAAIFQSSNFATASVLQHGSGNRAVIVQN